MDNSKEILSILNDDESRNILKKLLSEELTIQQISSTLNISQSSAYRKIRRLEDAGLIKKSKVIRTLDGSDENYYKSAITTKVRYTKLRSYSKVETCQLR